MLRRTRGQHHVKTWTLRKRLAWNDVSAGQGTPRGLTTSEAGRGRKAPPPGPPREHPADTLMADVQPPD